MKKSLILTSAIGAITGYLLAHKEARKELLKAESPGQAAQSLARHMAEDGAELAEDVRHAVNANWLKKNWETVKRSVFHLEKQEKEAEKTLMESVQK